MKSHSSQIVLIDGRHLLYRAADVNRMLSANGVSTGGVYGMLTVLVKMCRRYQGAYFICWEGTKNFRRALYPDYKKKPSEQPEHLIAFRESLFEQESILRTILSLFGIRQFESVGGEADDVIGTLAVKAVDNGLGVSIFSGDSDLHQLVNENCVVIKPDKTKDALIDVAAVAAKYELRPNQIPSLKAIAGDSSDNIPGVPGIGAKSATKMLQTYDTLDGIKSAIDNGEWAFSERWKKLMSENFDKVALFHQLTVIKTDITLKAISTKRNVSAAKKELRKYKMRRLLDGGNFHDLCKLGE